MRTNKLLLLIFILFPVFVYCQEEENPWEFNAEVTTYIIPGESYANPVISADKNHLHLEARYNY
jgi:hypothetical protein